MKCSTFVFITVYCTLFLSVLTLRKATLCVAETLVFYLIKIILKIGDQLNRLVLLIHTYHYNFADDNLYTQPCTLYQLQTRHLSELHGEG